ncbi:cell division protein FtsQ/DivIB [Roseomonas sp. NAR14]|uniref:Cell division protein FtsQ n=1 Tax=Roseomonas acroporae TaxID=2937791 RepID=A0A9X2BTC0_9PROT|nr:cell division protein FtsQ/DivIB [Roseomonas acroporae]MCK8783101.1 cell division protein FtsQ/DivIB [Roseomonas acroporae]
MARSRADARIPDRPSPVRLWLRRNRALLRPAGYGVAALAALGVLGFGLYALAPAERLAAATDGIAAAGARLGLTVREIAVEGRRYTAMDLVRTAVGANRGDPLLDFSPATARERLELLDWVESATVERHLNGTIVVRLVERTPFAIWQHQGRFAILDAQGKVVTAEGIGNYGPLPLVVGAGADRAAVPLIAQLRTRPEIMVRTQAMVRISERRWNLRLHNGTDVLLPEGQEAAALSRLAELQAGQALLDRPLAAIDMRLPDKLVLRQQGQPPAQDANPAPRGRSSRG